HLHGHLETRDVVESDRVVAEPRDRRGRLRLQQLFDARGADQHQRAPAFARSLVCAAGTLAGVYTGARGSPERSCGITSRAKSCMLSSTGCCGTISIAFSRKLMPVTPIDSHRLIVRTRWSGSPTPTPSGKPFAALGSSAGGFFAFIAAPTLPSVWYARVGNAS